MGGREGGREQREGGREKKRDRKGGVRVVDLIV